MIENKALNMGGDSELDRLYRKIAELEATVSALRAEIQRLSQKP
jgi:uncharacterized small protein (DUF1192 family)